MTRSCALAAVLLAVGCGSSGAGSPSGTGGAATGGNTSTGGSGGGGSGTGGNAATGGSASGGTGGSAIACTGLTLTVQPQLLYTPRRHRGLSGHRPDDELHGRDRMLSKRSAVAGLVRRSSSRISANRHPAAPVARHDTVPFVEAPAGSVRSSAATPVCVADAPERDRLGGVHVRLT